MEFLINKIIPLQATATPIDSLIVCTSIVTVVALVFFVFLGSHLLTKKGGELMGLSAATAGVLKHSAMNFLIFLVGAISITLVIWSLYYPLPYDSTSVVLAMWGVLLGISFGFLTFYAKYRGG
jgi:hypothetical protein